MRYLLTGGSGVLGTELQRIANDYGIEFYAPSHKEFPINYKPTLEKFAWNCDEDEFDGVIHCAGYTDVPKAEYDRPTAIEINIDGTSNMSWFAYTLQIKRFVYISTDYVYPGISGNYKETDFTQPVNFYAVTKLVGESVYYASDPFTPLIIRTSFKPNKPWPYPKAFSDLYTSADYVDVIAPKIMKLVAGNATGIFNVGTERKSVYELAKRRNPGVEPMSTKDIADVHLPYDVSMNIDKLNTWEQEND